MGYYATYWSTLLKGLRMTSLKERIEIRRIVNNLRKADHTLYKSLFEDVEKTHQVTQAQKEETKILKELKISADNAYSLIFNLSTEEFTLLETIEDILKQLDKFSNVVRTLPTGQLREVDKEFALAILEALQKAQKGDRGEYQQIMTIIGEAEEKDPKKFMAAVRLAFQKETTQTILAKFAARREVRTIKVDILDLKKIPRIIEGLTQDIQSKVSSVGEMEHNYTKKMKNITDRVKKDLHDVFLELFLLKKRDMFWILKVLLDLHNLINANKRWAADHLIPRSAMIDKNKEIMGMQLEISKHFHVVAQAFRILISRLQRLANEAGVEVSLIK